jgi:hypothetical protein
MVGADFGLDMYFKDGSFTIVFVVVVDDDDDDDDADVLEFVDLF